jgi:site-specific recombinase XerD
MASAGTIRREPSIPSLEAQDLTWLIGQYVSWQRTQLDNQKTVDSYACNLRWFSNWWDGVGPAQGWLLHQADLEQFERYLRTAVSNHTKRTLSWNARNDVMRRLREMFHFAYAKAYTDRDYAEWIPKADGAKPKRRAVGILSLIKLLAEAGNSSQAPRDRALLRSCAGAFFFAPATRKLCKFTFCCLSSPYGWHIISDWG